MRLVVIESPYAGNVSRNVRYARACVRDCLARGEAPYASHLFYTQPDVLDDTIPEQRALGIEAGLAWGECALATVVYTDLGWSTGMRYGVKRAEAMFRPVEYRKLGVCPECAGLPCDCPPPPVQVTTVAELESVIGPISQEARAGWEKVMAGGVFVLGSVEPATPTDRDTEPRPPLVAPDDDEPAVGDGVSHA